MAGNQLGKTTAGAAEVAMHATGLYPEGWQGRRFDRPTVGWAAGITAETTRDTVQRLLLGRPRGANRGLVPDRLIEKVASVYTMAGATDTVMIRHVTGGLSVLAFKSYEKGRAKWQGESLDYVWFDEEPPADVYSEGLTRISATGGMVFMTFTPLLGMSEVVRRFIGDPSPDRNVTQMTIEDALHIAADERARIVAGYPRTSARRGRWGCRNWARAASFRSRRRPSRSTASPSRGTGPSSAGSISAGTIRRRRCGSPSTRRPTASMSPTAYRQAEATPTIHAAILRAWGAGLDWAWPARRARRTTRARACALAELYREQGLVLLRGHATFEDGSMGVEAGLIEMLERMQSGRWKVFRHLTDWFEEFRLYHRRTARW